MRDLIDQFLESVTSSEEGLFPYLANGGPFDPDRDWVYYSGPYWDRREVAEMIHSALKGKWLSSGEKVARFERAFGRQFELPHNVMVNSGSSANLAMIGAVKKTLGWQDGDEVVVCVCGFPTTIAPLVQNGLRPVFVDIDWSDLNWDLEQVERAITPRTRAVFSSPVLGNPYDFDRIQDICHRHQLELISDNCDSLGSRWRGQYLTSYSIAASCSFYPAHHLCTIEGGMVSSTNEAIVSTARSLSWWGRDCHCVGAQNLIACGMCGERFKQWLPSLDEVVDHKYVFVNRGYNLKPLDLQGGVGLVQLTKWDEIHAARLHNYNSIRDPLSRIPGVRVVGSHPNAETSWFGVPVVCDTPDLKRRLVSHLESNRIQTRNYFAGNILLHPGYKDLGDAAQYPQSTDSLRRVFFLGCSPTITQPMIDRIKTVLDSFVP